MALKLDKDVKLVLYGIVVTAYMTIAYQIAKDWMTIPVNNADIIKTTLAGVVSLGVGIGVLAFLIHKKRL